MVLYHGSVMKLVNIAALKAVACNGLAGSIPAAPIIKQTDTYRGKNK